MTFGATDCPDPLMIPAPKGQNPPAKQYKLSNKDRPSQRQSASLSEAARLIKAVQHSTRNNAQHLEILIPQARKRARHRVFVVLGMFIQNFKGATNSLTETYHQSECFNGPGH